MEIKYSSNNIIVNKQSLSATNTNILKSVVNFNSVESDFSSQKVYLANLSGLGINIEQGHSASFKGLFSSKYQNEDDKPYSRKIFLPIIRRKDRGFVVNTSSAPKIYNYFKENIRMLFIDRELEVLSPRNKIPLTNGQVKILNTLLSEYSFMMPTLTDLDYAMKMKDTQFAKDCIKHKIRPLAVRQEQIAMFKYLSALKKQNGEACYRKLYASDINNVPEDKLAFFDRIYNYKDDSVFEINTIDEKAREVFLQNSDRGSILLDTFDKGKINIPIEQQCQVLKSKDFGKWIKVFEAMGQMKKQNSLVKELVQSEFCESLFDYDVDSVAKAVDIAVQEKLPIHVNCLFGYSECAQAIVERYEEGDKKAVEYISYTGQQLTPEARKYLDTLYSIRKPTRADYAMFELLASVNFLQAIPEVLFENPKPNLIKVIDRYVNDRENYNSYGVGYGTVINLLSSNEDFTDKEVEVINNLFEEYPKTNLNTILMLKKVGYLNQNLSKLNYSMKEIGDIPYESITKKELQTILDLNIKGFVPSEYKFLCKDDESKLYNRLASLKEVSLISPDFVKPLVKKSGNFDGLLKLIKYANEKGINKDVTMCAINLDCVDEVELNILDNVYRKTPQLLKMANEIRHNPSKMIRLLEIYSNNDVFSKYSPNIIYIGLMENIPVNMLIKVAELLRLEPDIYSFDVAELIALKQGYSRFIGKPTLKAFREQGIGVQHRYDDILERWPRIRRSSVIRDIENRGGVRAILASMIESSLMGEEPISPVNQKAQSEFFLAITAKKLTEAFEKFDCDEIKNGIPLKYSRDQFKNDLGEILTNYSDFDVNVVADYFKFPFDLQNGFARTVDSIPENFTQTQKELSEKINKIVHKFIYENEVILPEYPQMQKLLNSVIAIFPEFLSVVGKKQHNVHDYTVDVHTLKVLQSCVEVLEKTDNIDGIDNKDEIKYQYKNLSRKDKTALYIAVLLHDLGKEEAVVDKGHYKLSALYTRTILKKMKLNDVIKDKIYNLVENHHWLGQLATGEIEPKEVASVFRVSDDYKLARVFAEADLKGVSDSFYDSHVDALYSQQIEELEERLRQINETGVPLFVSKIVKLNNIPKKDGVRVLNLTRNPELIPKVFGHNATRDNLRLLIHTCEPTDEKFNNLKVLTSRGNEGSLSASYVSYDNKQTYYGNKFGVLLDTTHSDILVASPVNLSSGCAKGKAYMVRVHSREYETFKERAEAARLICHVLGASKSEYGEIFKHISTYSNIEQIKDVRVGKKIFKKEDIIDALQEFGFSILSSQYKHNEIVVFNPKLRGLVALTDSYKEVPEAMKEFAKKQDLPIILLGKNKDY